MIAGKQVPGGVRAARPPGDNGGMKIAWKSVLTAGALLLVGAALLLAWAPWRTADPQAGLVGGIPTVVKTANGDLQGRVLTDVPVSLGPAQVSGVRVGVGLVGAEPDEALLGQSFLNQFEITLSDKQMTLKPKSR